MEKVVLQEILNIQNPEDFYVKLDKIDQFGIDTKSLYINDQPKLLEEMGYYHDTGRKTKKAHWNYVMDRPYTIHLIPYDEANKLWLFVGAYSQSGTYQKEYKNGNIYAYGYYGTEKIKDGSLEEGERICKLGIQKGDPSSYLCMSVFYEQKGNKTKSKELFEKYKLEMSKLEDKLEKNKK